MKHRNIQFMAPVLAGLMLLSACSENGESQPASEAASVELPGGITVKEQIEARQAHLKKIGKAFKSISDQLKAGSPDLAEIQAAAAIVPKEAEGMADWFPEGTGPDAGVKTAALPVIWEDKADFNDKIAQGGDVAAIATEFQATGGKCKACHDKYRKDD